MQEKCDVCGVGLYGSRLGVAALCGKCRESLHILNGNLNLLREVGSKTCLKPIPRKNALFGSVEVGVPLIPNQGATP